MKAYLSDWCLIETCAFILLLLEKTHTVKSEGLCNKSDWEQGPNRKQYINLHKSSRNKNDSKNLCKEVGGILPKPKDINENHFLERFADFFYLGMNDVEEEGDWVWDDETTSVHWLDWFDHSDEARQPDGGRRENCAQLQKIGRYFIGWADVACSQPATTVICQRNGFSWTRGPNGKQYVNLYEIRNNKENSRRLCREVGGALPKPKDKKENDFLKSFAEFFYLGMNDNEEEGEWVWDDEATRVEWNDWQDGEMDSERRNCTQLRHYRGTYDKSWHDTACTGGSVTVVCERQAASPTQATTTQCNETGEPETEAPETEAPGTTPSPSGGDMTECTSEQQLFCLNGGQCISHRTLGVFCRCTEFYTGIRCDVLHGWQLHSDGTAS